MTEFRRIAPDITVSGQIGEADVKKAAREGARLIVCNRPDGEEPGQPDAASVARWAAAEGLGFAHIPIVPGAGIPGDAVASMRDALAKAGGPVHAYCKAGGRAAAMWALAAAADGRHPVADILARCRKAGFDLSTLEPMLRALAADTEQG
ncbi:MAG: TIGR01244 family sulfur transferase [Rhodothalassiaceae bacterium]